MTNLSVFDFPSGQVRVVIIDSQPWFVAKDVLKAMGSKSRTNDVKAMVEEDLGDGYDSIVPLKTAGGIQQTLVLSEPALTIVVSRSRTELGKQFNRWIHAEVLPSIRKTGSYGLKGNKKAIARSEGKEHRTELEDAIKAYIEAHPELSDNAKRWMYKNATDTIYRQVYAATAAKLVEALGCDRHHLRDQLSFKELAALTSIEGTAARLIEQLDMYPVDAIVEAVERTLLVGKFKEMHSQPALKEGK